MHEFALAQDIMATIEQQVKDDFVKVTAINIEIGAYSGVVADSLSFGIDIICKEKNLSDVEVNIAKVPTIARCKCGREYELSEIFETCPQCGSFEREIISGMDIVINSVELAEE